MTPKDAAAAASLTKNDRQQPPRLVLGAANFGSATDPFCRTTDPDQAVGLLTAFASHGHTTVDTSRRYPPGAPGTSEVLIGEALRALAPTTRATVQIDTKVLSTPGAHSPENVAASLDASLAALDVAQVHTIYLHFPDRSVPLSSPVLALSDAVTHGRACQWGLSNYIVADMREILSLCDAHGWVRPRVYQGEYNALSRGVEDDLIPFLHAHGLAFYAFSPGAGGVFAATGSRIHADTPGGQSVRALYGSDEAQAAVLRVRDRARQADLGRGHAVALRWAAWDGVLDGRFGDAVIVGAGSQAQLVETLHSIEHGPLPDDVKATVDAVWASLPPRRE